MQCCGEVGGYSYMSVMDMHHSTDTHCTNNDCGYRASDPYKRQSSSDPLPDTFGFRLVTLVQCRAPVRDSLSPFSIWTVSLRRRHTPYSVPSPARIWVTARCSVVFTFDSDQPKIRAVSAVDQSWINLSVTTSRWSCDNV